MAFMHCTNLTNVNIPNKLKVISTYTFYTCTSLSQVIIPDSVISLGQDAFGYTNISSINISKNVTSIGNYVFEKCNNLEEIIIDKENENFKYEEGILYDVEKGKVKFIANSKLNNETFEFPYGIKRAGLGGTTSNDKIETIKIPETVTSINFSDFNSLINLKDIEIASGNATYMKENGGIYNKDENNKILYYYFKDIKDVVLEEGIKKIDSYAFAKCRKLESITFPHSLETINNLVFYNCGKLKNIKIEENLSSITGTSFYGISPDANIEISTVNNYYVFENGMLLTKDKKELIRVVLDNEEVVIPYGIEKIADYAFHAKTKLKNVIIPDTVKQIGSSFQLCDVLEKIEIPSSIESIGLDCFERSLNVKEVIIHKKRGEVAGSPWGCVYGDRAIIWDK